MMKKSKIIKMNYSTYLRIRHEFKATYKESMPSYFERLARYLENSYPTIQYVEDSVKLNNRRKTMEPTKKEIEETEEDEEEQ